MRAIGVRRLTSTVGSEAAGDRCCDRSMTNGYTPERKCDRPVAMQRQRLMQRTAVSFRPCGAELAL